MANLNFRMPTIRSAAAAMAIALIVVSVLVALVRPLGGFLLLAPHLVLSGFVWQLVTYAFIEMSEMGVIFGALILWSLGGMLEASWGRRRFLSFSFGVVALAAVATVVLSLVFPEIVAHGYPGGTVLTGALWVAYGLQIGRGQTSFWGLAVTGNVLALIGVGFVFLSAAFSSFTQIIPQAFGLFFTFLYIRGVQPRLWWVRFRSWQLDRDLKKRAAPLKSIDGGRRNVGRDSDKYLHCRRRAHLSRLLQLQPD